MTDNPLTAELRRIHNRNEYGDLREVAFKDVPRLLAALNVVLKLADEWAEGSYTASSALDEDRVWVRAECGAKLREATTRELLGNEAP